MLENIKKIHLIGIGGAGMRAIANVLIQKGFEVSGSDIKESPITKKFAEMGAKIYIGQKRENVLGKEIVVVSTAIREDNEELVSARENNIPVIHRSDIVKYVLDTTNGIAVAGAHGKTTTTSMIGQIFEEALLDPTIIIGGEVDYLGGNSKLGKGEYSIVEADESDGSFRKLNPKIEVITNIENDHMDFYKTTENLLKAFETFIGKLPEDGVAVVHGDNEHIKNFVKTNMRPFITYGLNDDNDYVVKNIKIKGHRTTYDVCHKGSVILTIELKIPGEHNILNSLAAVIVALHCGVDSASIQRALAKFIGAKRRFEHKGLYNGVWVVDDYAHHPTEINATLTAAKEMETHRVVCVFQPHRYTRTQLLLEEYSTAFKNADVVVMVDIYSAGEDQIDGIDGMTIPNAVLEATGQEVIYIENADDLPKFLADFVQKDDLVITMGAGNINTYGPKLLSEMKSKMKQEKIIVLLGGPSTEAAISRKTGGAIANALQNGGYDAVTLEFNPQTVLEDIKKLNGTIVFNALHGKYGEDGAIQGFLEIAGIPYTGSGIMASAVGMNKKTFKDVLEGAKIATAKSLPFNSKVSSKAEICAKIRENFTFPVVVKAATQGSSIGVAIVKEDKDLDAAIDEVLKYDNILIAETYLAGKEFTVGVLDGKAMPVIMICPHSGNYDFESKYTVGATEYLVPAPIDNEMAVKMQKISEEVYQLLQCEGVARVDIMTDANNEPYVLEINTIPGMTETSLVPKSAKAMGMDFLTLCETILQSARINKW